MKERQITVAYLRQRAAHYRDLMVRTADPRRAARYRDLSQLLDKEAEALARDLNITTERAA
jgi:hypothetical protein